MSYTLPSRQVIEEIVRDVRDRQLLGIQRYGRPLVTFNGREGLRDLYEEQLDSLFYTQQLLKEDNQALSALATITGCLAAYGRGLQDGGVQANLVLDEVYGMTGDENPSTGGGWGDDEMEPDEEREEYEREANIR